MKVAELVEKFGFTIFAGKSGLQKEISGGYVSDLLSDVMGFATENQVWITLQTHQNVIAIASLVVSACGTASTAPRNDDSTIVTSGSGG